MKDKEKIKFWAKGRLFEIMNRIGENDAKNILTDLLSFIDSMQEEPEHWHCSIEELPKERCKPVLVCAWDEELKTWIYFDICEYWFEEKLFHISKDEEDVDLKPSPNVFWRIIEKPDPPIQAQDDTRIL